MTFRKCPCLLLLLLSCVAYARAGVDAKAPRPPVPPAQTEQTRARAVEFISAEELKAKLARNDPVTILDVRATSAYVDSDNTIKGAIHIKLRRLRSRLFVAPLKSVPRNGEVVTYCACPADESSVQAAQILSDAGFTRVRVLKDGWRMWLKVKGQTVARPKAN